MKNSSLPTTTDLETLVRKGETPVQFFKIDNVFEDELMSYPQRIADSYEYDEETRTYSLPEYEWLKWREHGPFYYDETHPQYIKTALGGSDIGALFDGSKLSKMLHLYAGQHGSNFKSAIELYSEKTGSDFTLHEKVDPEVFLTGHIEEPVVRKRFKQKYQKDHPLAIVEVYNDCHMYQCGAKDSNGELLYPFILCDLDGIVEINGMKGVLECKTCSFSSEDYPLWKQGIVPMKYYLQVCWYMACMNFPYAYICCKWGQTINDMVYIYIERDFDIEREIIGMAQEFIRSVELKQPPQLMGQSVNRLNIWWRKKMGPVKPNAPVVKLDSGMEKCILAINDINAEIKKLESQINTLKQQRKELLVEDVFPVFGESTYGYLELSDGTKATVKLKNNTKIPEEVDEEGLKRDYPEIYKKYVIRKTIFNKSLFKKEQKLLAEEYISQKELTESMQNYCEIQIKK